ncbi:molybdate ABC transporter substrate-binding protein [Virgibacillus oceani]|uniref:Molybdate ABC transporter substrate-binding protein n=1 Tax=Virgibacillus oceani TaxID=1479511 RepID=A0A917M4H9_9BACI|nr:molybdate ABC transporter substrate-binding protein [Virgibacillus oceani]GGG76439.1 molybdate ABC transporter substrate-binding protein [Virgibacillus oceani]
MRYILLFFTCLLILAGCTNNDTSTKEKETAEIFVSAAASLSDAITEIKNVYEAENPGSTITLNFGGSGKLAQQIQQGAPVDVFLSANQNWMDVLEGEKLILEDTRTNFTKNSLVMIGKKDATLNLDSFKDMNHDTLNQIAIGNPESVPAGNYAKEVLETLNKWDELKDKFVYAKDVSQVLAYVESGNTEIGFVYSSDVLRSDKVEIIDEADQNWHSPIVYPAAVTSSSDHNKEASSFVKFLQSDKAQSILAENGFTKNTQ